MGLKPALFWLGLILFLTVSWEILDLPTDDELETIVSGWIATYGLAIVLVGSFLEALLFIGFYFPGSLIIFLSVALAPSPQVALLTIVLISIGMFLGYSFNFALGKYGWYKLFLRLGMRRGIENAQVKMQKNDIRYVFYTFWNPGFASFTSTAAGTLHIRYRRFTILALSAIAVWNALWGILVYSLGETALTLVDFTTVLKVIALWFLIELGLFFWRKNKKLPIMPEVS